MSQFPGGEKDPSFHEIRKPISLFFFLGRNYENVLLDSLKKDIIANNLVADEQFGSDKISSISGLVSKGR